MSQVDEILGFWFGRPDEADYGKGRKIWFVSNPEFDEEIRRRFKGDYEKAASSELEDWKHTPQNCLALIILLDQFPRNLFRGDARSYGTDLEAISLAQYAIAKGFDLKLLPVQRLFTYLPFGHSENIEHQRQALELLRQLSNDPNCSFIMSRAVRHLEVIERFGRFPHRNSILGRTTTPEEAEFLKQPGSSF